MSTNAGKSDKSAASETSNAQKLIFVTGAGRGIGRAIALKLAEEGYQVCGCSRTAAELEKTRILSQGKIKTKVIDVADSKQIETWFEEEGTQARPWGLVTAAGIYGPIGPFIENSWDDWRKAIEINLLAPAYSLKTFAALLCKNNLEGRAVLLSGGGATKPQPGFTSYCASKAAIVRFAETMAHELKDRKITVNALAPGAVNTHFTEELLKAGPEKVGQKIYDEVLNQKKSGGTSPSKAADLTAYLMSEKASGITGRLISAVWDPWSELHGRQAKLEKSDIYTLRRIIPEDRGEKWD